MGDFNVAMTPKDVHPSIPFEGLYGAQEMAIMQVGGAGAKGLQAHMLTCLMYGSVRCSLSRASSLPSPNLPYRLVPPPSTRC